MPNPKGIEYFNNNAEALTAQYNAIDRADVHKDLIGMLPKTTGLKMLDVGAGSGADAFLFAEMGNEVVAVEPATKLSDIGQKNFKHKNITWVDDTLPGLKALGDTDKKFDVVYAIGTVQYLDKTDRRKAFNKMAAALKDGGLLEIQYPSPASREYQYSVPAGEMSSLVKAFNARAGNTVHLEVVEQKSVKEQTGRKALDGSDLYFNVTILKAVPNV